MMQLNITDVPTKILKPHIQDELDPNFKKYRGYHTGVDIIAASVYNLCPGVVVLCGKESIGQIVIVQYDLNNCISYRGFESVAVTEGQFVDTYQYLGHVKSKLHVDYITSGENVWPVRIGDQTLYKHDPTDIILHGYESFVNYFEMVDEDDVVYSTDDELPLSVSLMLFNNRGGASYNE